LPNQKVFFRVSLAAEGGVQAAGAHIQRLLDVLHRGRVIAALPEQINGAIQRLLAIVTGGSGHGASGSIEGGF